MPRAGCWCDRAVESLQGYVAPLRELAPFLALGVTNLELQRWIHELERRGPDGRDPFLRVLYLTSLVAMAAILAALATWALLGFWVVALTSFLLRFPVNLVYTAATRSVFGLLGADRAILGIAGFWGSWALVVWLAVSMSSRF